VTSPNPDPLTCRAQTRAGVTVLHLAGELDLSAESAMNQAIASALAARPRAIVVDLAGLSFLDSTGVRCLIIARRDATSAGIVLTVEGATGIIEQVLTITGVLPAFAAPEPSLTGQAETTGLRARLGRLTGASRRNPRS
jgi:anti-sigma B factor antagonist